MGNGKVEVANIGRQIPDTTGETITQAYTAGAAHVYGLARNMVRQAAGTYSATEVLGLWVEAQPTADDTDLTPVDGSAISNVNKEAFTEGNFVPTHLSSITVGTGGEFLLVIPS